MRPAGVRPTGIERTFGADELIVSKTDLKGILTYVNGVFCRISAAHEDDLLGRPHSVIRHPDMPRAVFQLMWQTIASGQEIFVYVKNLALDGAHYWVFAHVTPSTQPGLGVTGYHSSRRSPDRRAVAAVEPLYRTLRDIETSHASSREGLAASTEALRATLDERGMTYDEFVWSVTP